MQNLHHALPLVFPTKACLATLGFSVSSSLSIVLWLSCPSSSHAPGLLPSTIASNLRPLSVCPSLPLPLDSLCVLPSVSADPLAASNAIEEVSRRILFSKPVRRILGSFIQNPTWPHDFQPMMQRDHLSFANYYLYISETYSDEVSRSLQTQRLPHRLLKLGLMVRGLSPLAPCYKIIWTYKYSASGGDTRSSFEFTL